MNGEQDYGIWFGAQANNGLVVSDLTNNSVFANAGLREGDVILAFAGQPVAGVSKLEAGARGVRERTANRLIALSLPADLCWHRGWASFPAKRRGWAVRSTQPKESRRLFDLL